LDRVGSHGGISTLRATGMPHRDARYFAVS
jgi:hypothetical protein